jgi:hypothetical protein
MIAKMQSGPWSPLALSSCKAAPGGAIPTAIGDKTTWLRGKKTFNPDL